MQKIEYDTFGNPGFVWGKESFKDRDQIVHIIVLLGREVAERLPRPLSRSTLVIKFRYSLKERSVSVVFSIPRRFPAYR